MSWDVKESGIAYFYRSERVNGKPTKIYVGRGRKGAEAEQQDRARRLQQQRDRQHWEAILFQSERATLDTAELASLVTLLHKAILINAGYYLHKGHEWRKRRAV
ncbi:hypothetical protein [Gimesia chilikensis]|uniref:Uncharacterized protein n=1 Tax=Gimesia chilikensis TaxID=2605989 RepID=A0A517PPT3_9PLAN|nr:hypothetical protein [Gimesia chilikensis]QDT21393.1 hypothetical protein HG66A1_31940 [Gimesia chilikensis]